MIYIPDSGNQNWQLMKPFMLAFQTFMHKELSLKWMHVYRVKLKELRPEYVKKWRCIKDSCTTPPHPPN